MWRFFGTDPPDFQKTYFKIDPFKEVDQISRGIDPEAIESD
jgi:hypothetical protein